MPQRVSLLDENDGGLYADEYLTDDIDLKQGSVDDQGDAAYVRLSQNVPDGYRIARLDCYDPII